MISENKMRSLLIILAMLLSSTALAFGPQSSNKNVLWGFDFVEEFDGLQDWNQSACSGPGGLVCGDQYETTGAGLPRMPKLSDGSASAWGYFSYWSTSPQTLHPWIGGGESRPVWRGDKSFSLDLGSSGFGPSRLGVYTESGYEHVHVFYMVYLPRNLLPTRCYALADPSTTLSCSDTSRYGSYVEGQPYVFFSYYKFNDMVIGCQSSYCPNYGEHPILTNLEYRNPQYPPGGIGFTALPRGQPIFAATNGGAASRIDNLLDGWFGVEIEYELINGRTQNNLNMWIYDANGNAQQIIVDHVSTVPSNAQASLWNQLVLGGNKVFRDGTGLTGSYYIDDVIIDDGSKGQIGPRYFAAIAQDNVPVSKPNAATNFSYTTRSRDAVVAGGATRGNLTQCPDGKWATVCKATVYDVRINCTNPSTRENGNSFLPASIESLDWIFEPVGNGKTHSVKVPRCPFLVDLPPATYTVKQRTVLTHSGDGKVGNWSQISGSMEVPAP